MAECASNVEEQRPENTDQPDRTTTVAVGDGFPEEWRPTKDGDLKGRKVRRPLDGYTKVFGDVLVRRNDGRSCEGCHHGLRQC